MSPAMSALASFGITQQVLIIGILALVAAGVIGFFWHYILPGAIILLVAALFYVAPDGNTKKEPTVQETKEEVFDEYQAYLKDCVEIAEYTKEYCQKLWNKREERSEIDDGFKPADEVKLLEVSNKEYKARRAAAIQKNGAVVLQATYR